MLTNAQVLTEGVDVPALDAVLFLERRTSKIDVTQAVGRALRKAPDKAYGFVVIPVIVPEGASITDEQVLNGSDFKVLWDVVRALRSHDERVDYWVNNIAAAKSKLSPLSLSQPEPETDDDSGGGIILILDDSTVPPDAVFEQLRLEVEDKIASKLVDVCGDRQMWPHWGERAAEICEKIQHRVSVLIREDQHIQVAFRRFVDAMRKTVGPQITDSDAEEMVAQHVVTIPVFDAFFDKSEFAARNPVSEQINRLLAVFVAKGWTFDHERRPLTRAYQRMAEAFEGALTGGEKLDVLREVYDGFFQKAMRAEVKRLGIAYTPVELVDFIVKSVDAVCRQEFGRGVTAEGVNVLDPFTGTGTFVNRLLTLKTADGEYLIRDEDLARKFAGSDGGPPEIHANEIVLLAYYIAALKIEEGAEERGAFTSGGYRPFEGIVLTDTFRMTHKQMHPQLPGSYMRRNSLRATAQNRLPIQVILGNPPWSAGQKSSGDDNPNLRYRRIAERVRATYGRRHKEVTGRGAGKSAGNLYVQAIRWASDRLSGPDGNSERPGVLAFVHPNSLINGTSLAGMRAALRDEFTGIYVVNLRGDAYKSGEEFRREGDKVFGQTSRNGVQITVLVCNPARDLSAPAVLRYAEVPEYSSRAEKFEWLARLGDVTSGSLKPVPVVPQHHWINLPDGTFDDMLPVCSTNKADTKVAVDTSALGVTTACDVYAYSFSRAKLIRKMRALIDAYEDARELVSLGEPLETVTRNEELDIIMWTGVLKQSLKKDIPIEFDESRIREVLYRPFTKLWLYEDSRILSSVKTISAMFPRTEITHTHTHTHTQLVASESSSTKPNSSPSPGSRPTGYSTSAPQDDKPELLRDDHDLGAVEHGNLRGTGFSGAARPSHHGSGPADTDAAEDEPEAMILTGGSTNGSPDAMTATGVLPDLNGVGPARGGGSSAHPQTAIMITATNTRAIFSAVATGCIGDLCAVGTNQPSRTIPARLWKRSC